MDGLMESRYVRTYCISYRKDLISNLNLLEPSIVLLGFDITCVMKSRRSHEYSLVWICKASASS